MDRKELLELLRGVAQITMAVGLALLLYGVGTFAEAPMTTLVKLAIGFISWGTVVAFTRKVDRL